MRGAAPYHLHPMNKTRLPYLILLAGTLVMFLYPRVLPAAAPAALRADFAVGIAQGVGIGLEIVALMLLTRGRRQCA